MNNALYFILKALFVLKIFKFFPDVFDIGKQLSKKAKVYFKIYHVRNWEKINCNKHIARYLKNQRQPGYEIWSVNRIQRGKHFSSKIIQKLFFKKVLYEVKASVQHLIFYILW